jgi:hypothetical protein
MQTSNPSGTLTIGSQKALSHEPGPFGWSRIGDFLFCARLAELNLRLGRSASKQFPSRALFVGSLVHEYLAAVFQRIRVHQQGGDYAEWCDPWTMMDHHRECYQRGPQAAWVKHAINIGQTLLGIPRPGWTGPIPQDFEGYPDLKLWARTSDEILAVEEVGTWDLGDGHTYMPRLDLVVRAGGKVVAIDWKTTRMPCVEQALPMEVDKVKRHEKDLVKFHGASGQFQAMFQLTVGGHTVDGVRVGKIFAPDEKGPMFKWITVDRPPEAQAEELAFSMKQAIKTLERYKLGATGELLSARKFNDRICVSDYGPCQHYDRCHGKKPLDG